MSIFLTSRKYYERLLPPAELNPARLAARLAPVDRARSHGLTFDKAIKASLSMLVKRSAAHDQGRRQRRSHLHRPGLARHLRTARLNVGVGRALSHGATAGIGPCQQTHECHTSPTRLASHMSHPRQCKVNRARHSAGLCPCPAVRACNTGLKAAGLEKLATFFGCRTMKRPTKNTSAAKFAGAPVPRRR